MKRRERQPAPPLADDSPRHPWLLGLALSAITGLVVVALATSDISGTGSTNVGASAGQQAEPASAPDGESAGAGNGSGERAEPRPRRSCEPTESNPGGTNNYIPDAPALESLGEGFVVTGRVRSGRGCRPLAGVPIQIWLATETGDETDNRATVRSDPDGRYRIETDPTIPQFGEPNIHVADDGGRYQEVFIRRVVDLDDPRAIVNLTLARDG